MDRLERITITLELCNRLKEAGSWCGETHIQKAYYFLQELTEVPTGYEFVLYKHGPFSFDLRDDLNGMRADGYLMLTPQPYPYGPSMLITDLGTNFRQRHGDFSQRYLERIKFVACKLGDKGVADLERLSTALLAWKEEPGITANDLAIRVHGLKPHVSVELARDSVDELFQIIEAVHSEQYVA